ncbi:TetR/AcrR family transcriptional regulator [Yinghuangia soli]|uniref:TetR/AcrR family transcriptional regulator n=1 Tax=Yinghuangia soli TaxID=2908204 RepID=UPI001F2C402A|nr:TetR/AcrR family transcriptional regulator [Yinghuangia soli]
MRAATLAELADKGFAGLTVEGVAARSGVHKTTLYRRWGTPAALAADALDVASAEPWPVPDTGSLRADLRAVARQVVAGFTDPGSGPVARSLTAAALHDPDAGRALHAYLAARHAQAAVIVNRAADRGDVPAGTDGTDVVRCAVAPLYYRLFVTGEAVDEALADRYADAAATAAAAGVFAPEAD